jgi:hypothetical protein
VIPEQFSGMPAIAARLAVLEAERLAPVPRASHAAAVDVDDLAMVTAYAAGAAAAAGSGRRPDPMSADTAIAWQRLDAVVRGHARTARMTAPRCAGPRNPRPATDSAGITLTASQGATR